jgi:cell division protein FtsL
MRLRGMLTAVSAMLLLTGMFIAVHRGARGRVIAERVSAIDNQQEAAVVRKNELRQRVEYLRSRSRIVHAAQSLGLHQPSEEELVYLDLSGLPSTTSGGSL